MWADPAVRSAPRRSAPPPWPAHPTLGWAATPGTPPRRSARAGDRLPPRGRGGLGYITWLRVCIDIDLLLGADTRRHTRWRESVMRHFLAVALAPPRLSSGMTEAAAKRLLVAVAAPPNAVAPRLSGAGRRAIPLAVIAAPAHPQLLLTARTVPHPVADDVDRTTSSHKRLDAMGQSGHGQLRDTRTCRSQRRLPEGSRRLVLEPSPFAERARVTASASAKTLCPLGMPTPRERSRRKRSRSTKQMDRSKNKYLANDSGGVARSSPDSRTSCQPFTVEGRIANHSNVSLGGTWNSRAISSRH